jgi:hypothetical protein
VVCIHRSGWKFSLRRTSVGFGKALDVELVCSFGFPSGWLCEFFERSLIDDSIGVAAAAMSQIR